MVVMDKAKSILIAVIILFIIGVTVLIIASVAEASVKSQTNTLNQTPTSVTSANGFGGSIENQSLQITTSINGILKGVSPNITAATDEDITSFKLTGFDSEAAIGILTAEETILTAIEILNANINGFDIVRANGFQSIKVGSSFEIGLDILQSGLLQTDGFGVIQPAESTNVTSALLTGLVTVAPNTISPSDSILLGIEKLIANLAVTSANIIAGHGYQGSSGPSLGIITNITGLLKGDAGTGDTSAATASDVTGQLLTGYVSGAGTITVNDNILTGINKLDGNYAALNIISSGGFAGTFSHSTNAITLITTVAAGLVKAFSAQLQAATATDVTSTLLTGYIASPGTVSASDSILVGLEKVNGNFEALNVANANGFSGTFVPYPSSQFILATTFSSGIVKFVSSGLSPALATDITSQTLTGYASAIGTITPSDTILTSIGKLNGNQSSYIFGKACITTPGSVITTTGSQGSALTGASLDGSLVFFPNTLSVQSTLRVSATFLVNWISGSANSIGFFLFETQHNSIISSITVPLPTSTVYIQVMSETAFRSGSNCVTTMTANVSNITMNPVLEITGSSFNTGISNTIDIHIFNNSPPGNSVILMAATFEVFST